jgi:CDP-glucose 4,6-dehydratase
LVFITSDKCYRNKEWVWGYRENDELGGRDPYSASKAAAELVFAAYQDSFFHKQLDLGAATTRAGNVIGGGDWAQDRIVPDCIQALRDNKPILIRSPNATRPWQHVLEPLSGYLLLAAKLAQDPKRYGGSWNFGPSGSTIRTVEVLTRGIIQRWGSGKLVIDASSGLPYEARLLHLSIDKAAHHLGWHPRWSFEQTLDHTVNWYKAMLGGQSAYDVSRAQIIQYMEGEND